MNTCPKCEGSGKLIAVLSSWQKDYLTYAQIQEKSKPIECDRCKGTGKI